MKKNSSKLTYVIPHYGDTNLLLRHLQELNNQDFNDFNVVVVIDDIGYKTGIKVKSYNYPLDVVFVGSNKGPATARNIGVEKASADIVLFVGSDCLPDRHLISQHWWSHQIYDFNIVQGYTPWHSEVITDITELIDASGLQANWNALKNDGKWLDVGSANYCLTTNYSISKTRFSYIGKFDQDFTGAAWEDVEFGYRAGRLGLGIVINPNAINYHHHLYDFKDFLARSSMEGKHRWTICFKHPEMSWQILNPIGLKQSSGISLSQIYTDSKEIINARQADFDSKVRTFATACNRFSSSSAMEELKNLDNTMRYYPETTTAEAALKMIAGTKALEMGHISFALHTAEWSIADNDNWYSYAFAGTIQEAVGDKQMAIFMYRKALSRNPSDEYIKERIVELTK